MNKKANPKDVKSCKTLLNLTPAQDKKLRKLAKALKTKHTTLAASWVLERLEGEAS